MERPLIKRPAGVWILTIIVALAAGVMPAVIVLTVVGRDPAMLEAVGGPLVAILSLCFSAGVIWAAVGAWRGRNAERYELVVMAVLYYLHNAWVAFTALSAGVIPPEREPVYNGRVVRGILWAAIVTWYFLANPNAKRFYAAHAALRDEAERRTRSPDGVGET